MPPAAKPPTPEERHIRIEALKPAWLRDYIRSLEDLTRKLGAALQEHVGDPDLVTSLRRQLDDLAGQYAELERKLAETQAQPPDIRGEAVEGAVIRFGDFWTVHLAGPGLVVNTDEPMVLHPTSPDYLLIAKADQ